MVEQRKISGTVYPLSSNEKEGNSHIGAVEKSEESWILPQNGMKPENVEYFQLKPSFYWIYPTKSRTCPMENPMKLSSRWASGDTKPANLSSFNVERSMVQVGSIWKFSGNLGENKPKSNGSSVSFPMTMVIWRLFCSDNPMWTISFRRSFEIMGLMSKNVLFEQDVLWKLLQPS